MRRTALLAGAIGLLGVACYVWPRWAREYVKRGVRVEIEEALVREKQGRERSGLIHAADKLRSAVGALVADEIQVRLRVRNQTALPARIQAVHYRVRIGGHDVGAGAWTPPGGPQWFLPGRAGTIVAAFDPDWSALAGAGIDAARGRKAVIAVSGEITLSSGRVPFEVSRVGWTRQSR